MLDNICREMHTGCYSIPEWALTVRVRE